MSSRQIQRLLEASNSGDDDDDLGEMPSTMLVKGPKRKKRHNKDGPQASSLVGSDKKESSTTVGATRQSDVKDAQRKKKDTPKAQVLKMQRKSRHPPRKSGGDEGIDPDEAILEALEAARSQPADIPLPVNGEVHAFSEICDANWLDFRLERIRSFGEGSVKQITRLGGARYRPSKFSTPIPREWPPFVSCGAVLRREGREYKVDCNDDVWRVAQGRLEAVMSNARTGIHELRDLLQDAPYHIPTLLVMNTALNQVDMAGEAVIFLDMALHAVGSLLTSFPMQQSSEERVLPCSGDSRMIHDTIFRGVHAALSRGCGKTALSLAQLLLSMDSNDPMAMRPMLDYLGVRCREWYFVLRLLDDVRRHKRGHAWKIFADLPSLRFNAALARHLLDASRDACPSKGGNRTALSPAARDDVAAMPSAETLVEEAVALFPKAAVGLAKAVGLVIEGNVGAELEKYAATTSDDAVTATAFVKRSGDLWKSRAVSDLLHGAVQKWFRERLPVHDTEWRGAAHIYSHRPDVAEGIASAVIPMAALQEDDRQFMQQQNVEFLRLQAAFGPLDGSLSLEEQWNIYQHMLQEYIETRLRENPVALFVSTLWSSVEEVALRRAIAEAGHDDPAVAARAAQRALEEIPDDSDGTSSDSH